MEKESTSNWIWTPDWRTEDRQYARLVYFRKVVHLAQVPETCLLRITADTRYKLYVNSVLVQFGPSKGDNRIWYVDELDIASFLTSGENVLAVAVLRYPAEGSEGNHSLFRTQTAGLYIEGADLENWRCWINRATAFYAEEEGFAPLQIHETAALEASAAGWTEPGFDESAWENARPYALDELAEVLRPERLAKRTTPFMERKPHSFDLPAMTIPAHSEETFVLDAGEEMCAFLRLHLSGGKGAEIELLEAECYVTEQGKADRLDAEHGHLEGYIDRYTVLGGEKEVYAPYWFRTFRFIKVTVRTAEEPLTIHSFTYEETGYPLEVKTAVTTSDSSLSKIWDISLRTLRRCMHETYMDCPFYEQLQYAMDTRSQILYTYAVSGDDRLARNAIDDFSRAQRPDGLINCSYPNMNTNVIPGFSIYYILMVYDHMMYFGDKALASRYFPTIQRILDYFCRNLRPDGLLGKTGGENLKGELWSFIDWAREWLPTTGMPGAGRYGPLTMESLLYVLGLQKAAELAEWIGLADQAAEYRGQAEAVQQAIRSLCMDENGMITDGPGRGEFSQHGQVFGVLTGTLSLEEGRRNLLVTLRDRSYTQCTVAMCYYLFRALEKTGLYEYTDQYWEIWRKMLSNGCSTCVEAEDYARSECHAWGALALFELPSVVLGVRPAAPGYEKIRVRPIPGYLTQASGTVHTPKGDITVSWQREAEKTDINIQCTPDLRNRIVAT